MGIFKEAFRYIDWELKENREPPVGANVDHRWHEGEFPAAMKVLGRLSGETASFKRKLFLYNHNDREHLAVMRIPTVKAIQEESGRKRSGAAELGRIVTDYHNRRER